MNPALSIIIVNYNTKKLLEECLSSIIKNDKRLDFSAKEITSVDNESIPAEIIVVDNGSSDGSVETIRNFQIPCLAGRQANPKLQTNLNPPAGGPKIKLIENRKNLGFAKANNQAIKKSKGEFVLLLNSDTLVNEPAISQTLLWLSSHSEAAAAGCKLINPDGSNQGSFGTFPDLWTVFLMLFCERFFGSRRVRSSGGLIKQVDWLVGAFMMVRKSALRKVGLLDEKIFMYMEEVEWFYRLKESDLKAFFYPNAKIIHLGGASSVTGRTDPILNIYRGLVYFYRKHKSPAQLAILKIILKLKAVLSLFLGKISVNNYLTKTYGEAIKLV